jgi:hypothetical protein
VNEFPKMLYKLGDEIEWEGLKLATLIVTSAEHEAQAIADGFRTIDTLLNDASQKVAAKKAAAK